MTKVYNTCIFFVLFLNLSCSIKLNAQDTTLPLKFSERFIQKLTAKREFLLAPQLDRSPETGFLTGIYYLQMFKIGHDSTVRTSNTETTLSVTERKQFLCEVNNTLLFHKEKYILRGVNIFSKFNEYFWGIGNNSQEVNREAVEFNFYQVTQRLTQSFAYHIFAGVQYQFYQVDHVESQICGLLDTQPIAGEKGSKTSGLGLLFLYDSRDNVINPSQGAYLDVSNYINSKAFGSTFEFNNFTIDARRYINVLPKQILALQGLMNFNNGAIPFRQLATMGGDIMMRGMYKGRYRDNNMMALQAEYRFKVWKFIGLTVFGSGAEVAHSVNNFNTSDIRYTYGFAFRFMFIAHERVNVGIDFGFGRNTSAIYLGSGEAF